MQWEIKSNRNAMHQWEIKSDWNGLDLIGMDWNRLIKSNAQHKLLEQGMLCLSFEELIFKNL